MINCAPFYNLFVTLHTGIMKYAELNMENQELKKVAEDLTSAKAEIKNNLSAISQFKTDNEKLARDVEILTVFEKRQMENEKTITSLKLDTQKLNEEIARLNSISENLQEIEVLKSNYKFLEDAKNNQDKELEGLKNNNLVLANLKDNQEKDLNKLKKENELLGNEIVELKNRKNSPISLKYYVIGFFLLIGVFLLGFGLEKYILHSNPLPCPACADTLSSPSIIEGDSIANKEIAKARYSISNHQYKEGLAYFNNAYVVGNVYADSLIKREMENCVKKIYSNLKQHKTYEFSSGMLRVYNGATKKVTFVNYKGENMNKEFDRGNDFEGERAVVFTSNGKGWVGQGKDRVLKDFGDFFEINKNGECVSSCPTDLPPKKEVKAATSKNEKIK